MTVGRCLQNPLLPHSAGPRGSGIRALILIGILPWAAQARTPDASWSSATLANGYAAAVFDRKTSRLRDLWPHPYQEASPGRITPDLLWDAYFGLSRGGPGVWLPIVAPVTEAYENGTGIFVVVREHGGLRLTERWFAPMTLPGPGVVAHLTVRNLETVPISGVRIAFLQNFHVGEGVPEASADQEAVRQAPECACLVETGATSGRFAVAVPFPTPTRHASTPSNPYLQFPADGTLGSPGPETPMDDVVSAFAWDLPPLAPGGEVEVMVGLGVGENEDPLPLALQVRTLLEGDVLAAEREFWRGFHLTTKWPEDLRGDALAVARQSLAWLAMGQVREADSAAGTPRGQILASLPPGSWNRTWVRDQAYAIAALSAAGRADLAEEALRFLSRARVGRYAGEVGGDYGVSVCRYYGLGEEETDGDPEAEGPNIEFDGFGLTLWSLAEVTSRHPGLIPEVWDWAADRVAAPLAALVQPSGLIRPDSSIWERHWNGREKHFTYTQVTGVLGLCAAWQMGRDMEDPRAEEWREQARRVARAIADSLVTPDGVLAGSLEEIPTGRYLDAAVVEAFLWDILPPAGEVAQRTLDALLQGLAVPPGLRRNDDGDWYDRQEWVFVDLRVAGALRRAGRHQEAETIVRWVIAQTRANLDLPAELYNEHSGGYEGAVPMMGFGAGALILWLLDPALAVRVPECLGEPAPPEDSASEGLPEVQGDEGTPDPSRETGMQDPELISGVPDSGPGDGSGEPDPSGPPENPSSGGDPVPRSSGGCRAASSPASSGLQGPLWLFVAWAGRRGYRRRGGSGDRVWMERSAARPPAPVRPTDSRNAC